MESAWSYYYGTTKRMLSLAGQWPYHKRRVRFFRMSLLTVATFSMIVPQVAQIIHCNGNGRCILLSVPLMILMITMLVKLYTCQFNSNKIKSLTDHLHDDWEKMKDAEEYEIMKTYAANVKVLSLLYSIWCYGACVVFLSISLIPYVLNMVLPSNESQPIIMPFGTYYFVDAEEYFFYIFFHFFVSMNIAITGVIAHDCMLLGYIEHACSLFAIAGFRFETISRNVSNNAANNSLDCETYNRKIAISVHAHWRALRFAELLENTFCITFAIQMILVIVTMSCTLLQVTLQLNEFMPTVRYLIYVVGQVMHLFCYSLQGQKLINHSEQIRDKIYNSAWYEIPVKSQRLLLYVMRRSREFNFLSAGKMYVFSLKSFTTVMQSSVSYFTVLASF